MATNEDSAKVLAFRGQKEQGEAVKNNRGGFIVI
jgi:hypothetical protein